MDIGMPELNGIDATSLIRAASAPTQVVILSMHASAEHIVRALQAGALGYLLKESAGREVVAAVRSVHTQRRYVSEQISATMIDDYLTQLRNPQAPSPLASLSRREREVLQLVAEGHSSADIGRRLSLSPKTIETYRSRLMKKLGLEDIPSLVKFAVYHGLTPSP
jgi:two-component system, NarL family, response regulator NreC